MNRFAALMVVSASCLLAQCATVPQAPPPSDPPRFLEWPDELKVVGFKNIEKIWGTRPIRRGASVHPLPPAKTEVNPTVTIDSVAYTAESFMEANRVSGLLVVKNGEIVLERYGLGRKPDERWISASVAKSVTSTLVGVAVKDGHIQSLDDLVTTYIPELQGSAYETVTLRHLLTMTSGVKWNEDYTHPDSDVAKGLAVPPSACGENSAITYVRQLPQAAAPGSRFNYNSADIELVGYVLSRATGKTISSYLSEKIWAPFGMEADGVWNVDTSGHESAAGSVVATLRDFGRFGLFVLGDGIINGKQVLPAGWVKDATRPHVNEPQFSYGYLWWTSPKGTPYKGIGTFGQSLYIFPERQVVVVINSAWSAPFEMEKFVRQEYFVHGVVNAL